MCLSPHEMSSAELEWELQRLKEMVEDPRHASYRSIWEGRIKGLEGLLKERAENGTY